MTRALWLLVAASLVVTVAAVLWFVASTLPVRIPYWGEAEVIFEASRLRAHQPLFVDPLIGTADIPPSRYYVTYPPLFAWLVSFVPAASALVVARLACTFAWFGALGAIAWKSRRLETLGAALFVAGIWVLANFASLGRPDSIAAAVAALALWRATKKLDVLTIALLVLVPWIKPTMIGLPIGALLASRDRRAIAIAAGFALGSAFVAHVASGGAIFLHVVRSNAQPFALGAWLEQVPARLPFFAPFFAWAAWVGRRERIALGALAGAVLWTLIALAKTGSSSNYWMEPCIAALILIARAPRVDYMDRRIAAGALVAVLWADIASIRGAIEHVRTYRADADFVASLRAECSFVAADEAGIELVADGRVLIPTYQMAYLVLRGTFPAELWMDELRAPETRCYVEHTGQLHLMPAVARLLEVHFQLARERDGFRLWKKQ